MTRTPTSGGTPGVAYGLLGAILLGIGGAMLEDAMGSDWLTFFGVTSLGAGLVGIIAGGVALGTQALTRRD
ncbi:hypothetical protein HNR19_002931 [Nocardioides thalensis]|uniref:Uncharacterized protein n=1 Tax=Nocardioides thalensis TaxID=1914755 RepID=A0A853C7N4_9ACTN|nr:hypothetical protein [Nocardioides thalensis]NYJ01910.1 hypothetical protein [Nocardioides thalensis]NYJ02233.1 hypothetical protein [Nocardioides thalensis]